MRAIWRTPFSYSYGGFKICFAGFFRTEGAFVRGISGMTCPADLWMIF